MLRSIEYIAHAQKSLNIQWTTELPTYTRNTKQHFGEKIKILYEKNMLSKKSKS